MRFNLFLSTLLGKNVLASKITFNVVPIHYLFSMQISPRSSLMEVRGCTLSNTLKPRKSKDQLFCKQ